jgi:anti-sigma regulatory factor (Ser/Thr protein kinase)
MQHNAADTDAQTVIAEAHGLWAADPVHLPHIRALIRSWLAPLGVDSDTEQDLVLAVNEAVSNAIEPHGFPVALAERQLAKRHPHGSARY